MSKSQMSDPYYFGRGPAKTNGGVNKDTFDPTCQDMRENMKQCASAEENTIVDTIISLKARISSNCYDYDAHVSLIETLQHLTANGDSMIIDQMMAVINQEVGDNQGFLCSLKKASESSALECREIGQAQRTPRFPPPPNSDLSENMTVVDETKQIVQAHSFDASGFTGPMGVCLLRAAREHMANYFPLTEGWWISSQIYGLIGFMTRCQRSSLTSRMSRHCSKEQLSIIKVSESGWNIVSTAWML
ncbi:hypothetical protein RF11_00853 [Thelohanellus kitauei]|uniref:Uncharacterized protein n=1 Tax=Thelohanellus kitauei TaxID=669202 RepID=A0A0C2MD27_THEKT|nr:hypothetical protein RF11_00853 [Thelohanellus kitauei]